MLRGVNKQIIEINDTGNMFFERALLFVKPQYLDMSERRLESEADRFLQGIPSRPVPVGGLRRRRAARRRIRIAVVAVGAVLIGAAIFLLVR